MNLKYFSDPSDAENFEPFPIMFSRASVAYEGNGASLQTNQPSFIEGTKGVYGLGVYESYTNLLTSDQSTGTDTLGFSQSAGVVISSSNEQVFHGTKSLKIITPNDGVIGRGFWTSSVSTFPSTQYTASLRVLAPINSTLKLLILNNDYSTISEIPFTGTGNWECVTISGTTKAGATGILVMAYTIINAQAITFYVDNLQLIAKPYPLPWILGGTTRQPESCYIPVEEVKKFLKLNEGCIEGLIRVNSALKHASNKTILHLENGTNLLELSRTSANEWIFKTDNVSNPTNINLSDTTTLDNRVPFTIQYGGGKGRIIINGVSSNLTDLNLPTLFNNLIIGAKTGGSQHISTFLISLCFNKTRGVDDLINRQKFAKENGYYPIDDKVTAFLDLSTDLKGYRRVIQ